MKKYFLSAFLLLGLVIFYFTNQPSAKKRELIKELSPLACDLNTSACKVLYQGRELVFELFPKPLKVLQESKISIKNLPEIKNLNARLYGLNMYMGDIISEFSKNGDEYSADVVFSACTEGVMRYRLELFSGDDSLGVFADFDVRR